MPEQSCPSDAELNALLAGDASVAHLEDHIGWCPACQQRLNALASRTWRDMLVDGLDSDELTPERMSHLSMASENSPASDRTNTNIGRYEVVEEIARGGMGIVYRAIDTQLNRQVAIKLISRDRLHDAGWLERFRREARLTSSLNHPNIVTLHEVSSAGGVPFMVTEYVSGRTLRQLLNEQRLSVETTCVYALQIAQGLKSTHAAGIIHRDLKPSNIMIRPDGIVKILDFGLAKTHTKSSHSDSDLSRSGIVAGTVSYMSPEQTRGLAVDVSSDIFSFGIVLFSMLTGEQPFAGSTPGDVSAAILTRAPRPVSDFNHDVPPQINRLVFECLSKDAASRPTAEQVVHVLQTRPSVVVPVEQSLASETPTSAARDSRVTAMGNPSSSTAIDPSQLEPTEIRYARSGDINIAWQTIGQGPIDLVFVMGWVSHLDCFWQDPSFAGFLRRLATFSRVILFDKRGTGLSDKVPNNELPTLEMRMDDVRAVMDAAGSNRAVLCGVSEGGPLCTLFAATYPQKTIAITMIGCYARRLWAVDYPWGPTWEQRQIFLDEIGRNWGGPLGIEDRAPSKAEDPEFRKWWATYLRMGASPGAAVALTRMNAQIDVRQILPSIQVPTLVIHRTGDRCLLIEEGRHMADLIPGAKFVELPGDDHLPFVGDSERVLDEIEEFLTGKRHAPEVDRVLATVICLRVDAMDSVASAGDLRQFHTMSRSQAELFRAQAIAATDSTLLLTFDGPARGIRAASAVCGLAARLGIAVRCGADTGPCDIGHETVSGPAADRAMGIAARSPIGGVFVSDSVRNLVSGSGLDFVEQSDSGDDADALVLFQLVR